MLTVGKAGWPITTACQQGAVKMIFFSSVPHSCIQSEVSTVRSAGDRCQLSLYPHFVDTLKFAADEICLAGKPI